MTVVKPSAAAIIKSYTGAAVTFDMVGGFGIVNKFGMTAASAFISTSASISMSTAEAMDEISGDYLTDGLYHYGFKLEASGEAYGAVTIPANAKPARTHPRLWAAWVLSGDPGELTFTMDPSESATSAAPTP